MNIKQKGLTLVELMVTLAVLVAVMAIGVPMFQGMASSNRAVTQGNALVAALNLAKSEAIKRSGPVLLCSDADANVSTLVCGDQSDWAKGWIVFGDSDEDGVLDSGEELRVWGELSGAATVTTATVSLQFNSDGSASAGATFKVEQSKCSGTQASSITIIESGQIRTEKVSCS